MGLACWPSARMRRRQPLRNLRSSRLNPSRTGRKGRRLGADVAGARRENARHGQGDAAGLRHGPRVRRWPHGHRRRQARRDGDGHRVQPRHGRAVEEECREGRRQRTKATFVKADLFETDFSKATVITMFLLPEINVKLRPKILNLKPGHAHRLELLHDGRLGSGPDGNAHRRLHELVHGAAVDRAGESRRHLDDAAGRSQAHADLPEALPARLGTTKVEGKMNGDQITLTAGKTTYTGKVNGAGPRSRAPRPGRPGPRQRSRALNGSHYVGAGSRTGPRRRARVLAFELRDIELPRTPQQRAPKRGEACSRTCSRGRLRRAANRHRLERTRRPRAGAAAAAPAVAAPAAEDNDPVRTLVGRLDLEKYKATIKGLTQFGDRRQGTDRNRAASTGSRRSSRATAARTPSASSTTISRPRAAARARPARGSGAGRGAGSGRGAAAAGGQRGGGRGRAGQGGSTIFGNRATHRRQQRSQRAAGRQAARAQLAADARRACAKRSICTKIGTTRPDEMYIVGGHMDGHRLGRGGERRRLGHGAGDGAGAHLQQPGRADRALDPLRALEQRGDGPQRRARVRRAAARICRARKTRRDRASIPSRSGSA